MVPVIIYAHFHFHFTWFSNKCVYALNYASLDHGGLFSFFRLGGPSLSLVVVMMKCVENSLWVPSWPGPSSWVLLMAFIVYGRLNFPRVVIMGTTVSVGVGLSWGEKAGARRKFSQMLAPG